MYAGFLFAGRDVFVEVCAFVSEYCVCVPLFTLVWFLTMLTFRFLLKYTVALYTIHQFVII